jgi:hypothetical protein
MDKDNLIEFAKEQCEIFPEDSYMGEYLRETLKMLQAEPCEDAINRQAVLEVVENSCLDLGDYEDEKAFCYMISNLPPVKPAACIAKVNFNKEDMQEIVDKKVKEIFKAIPLERLIDFRNEVVNMNSIAIIQRLDKLIEEVEE